MSKYDCSKTLDYAHERNKMCEYYEICEDGCPLRGVKGCRGVEYITQKHIDIVQKWSDKHSEKTRKEAFREIFPFLMWFSPYDLCFNNLIGAEKNALECGEIGCEMCWDKIYNGEFEKAREEENGKENT